MSAEHAPPCANVSRYISSAARGESSVIINLYRARERVRRRRRAVRARFVVCSAVCCDIVSTEYCGSVRRAGRTRISRVTRNNRISSAARARAA